MVLFPCLPKALGQVASPSRNLSWWKSGGEVWRPFLSAMWRLQLSLSLSLSLRIPLSLYPCLSLPLCLSLGLLLLLTLTLSLSLSLSSFSFLSLSLSLSLSLPLCLSLSLSFFFSLSLSLSGLSGMCPEIAAHSSSHPTVSSPAAGNDAMRFSPYHPLNDRQLELG